MYELSEMHIRAINHMIDNGEMIPTKKLRIEMLNLEEFKFSTKDDGVVNIAELVKVKEFIDESINGIAWACKSFIDYHKDSPKYWGELGEKNQESNAYGVAIDLEIFMEDESESKEIVPGYTIPDNYTLAKKLLNKFEKAGNSIKGIEDVSFRECAYWDVKSKKTAQKLIKFIDDKYVQPYIKERMKFYKIEKINFLEKRMDFVFKKKKAELSK